jgi:putative transposase
LSNISNACGRFIVRSRSACHSILPDHVHAIWTLPPGDADLASRWSQIKSGFSREVPVTPPRSRSQVRRRETGIWQRRFWEHAIRDDTDFERYVDYIHFNPVKHGYVIPFP